MVTRKGIDALLNATADLLEVTPEFLLYDEEIEEDVVHYGFQSDEPEFAIDRDPDGNLDLERVRKSKKLFQMTNFDHDETGDAFCSSITWIGCR